MITDIFELMAAAGLPNAKTDVEFRNALIKQLTALNDKGNLTPTDDEEVESTKPLTVPEMADEIKKARRTIDGSPSDVDINYAVDLLIQYDKNNVDVASILDMDSLEVCQLEELPKKG